MQGWPQVTILDEADQLSPYGYASLARTVMVNRRNSSWLETKRKWEIWIDKMVFIVEDFRHLEGYFRFLPRHKPNNYVFFALNFPEEDFGKMRYGSLYIVLCLF